jgi:regulatory protein
MEEKYQIKSLSKKGRYFTVKINREMSEDRLHPDIVLEFSLYEGREIRAKEWDEVIEKNSFRFAWDSALRMLSLRGHCERDISNKLRKKGHQLITVEKVVNECKRIGLIDDAKFAKEYTRELKENGSGLKMIRQKLFNKGVPRELIDQILEDSFTEDDEFEAAKTALRKKLPSLKREKEPKKRKEKFYRYMISKGFSYEIIQRVDEMEA